MARQHAIYRSKQLARFDYCGRRTEGFGCRCNGDRIVVGIFPEGGDRFAGYIVVDEELTEHRVIEGVPAAVAFLQGD